MALDMIEVLSRAGFDPTIPTKLVRHTDRPGHPVQKLRRTDELEVYQSYQRKAKFGDGKQIAKQIISFYGLPGTRAGFYGVYKVLGCRPASEAPTSSPWAQGSQFFYNLERDPRFHDLRDQLKIDWGPGTLAWIQNLYKASKKGPSEYNNKLVLEPDPE
jgi:hypothetical protein